MVVERKKRSGALRENLHPELDALRSIVSYWDRWQAVRAGTPAYDLWLKLLRDAIESAREVAR